MQSCSEDLGVRNEDSAWQIIIKKITAPGAVQRARMRTRPRLFSVCLYPIHLCRYAVIRRPRRRHAPRTDGRLPPSTPRPPEVVAARADLRKLFNDAGFHVRIGRTGAPRRGQREFA